MKNLIAIPLVLVFCIGVSAQVVPDTLDPQRYYPLEVGNEWHYSGTAFTSPIPFYWRHKVASDTIVGGTTYFRYVREEFNYDRELDFSSTHYVRYNSVGSAIFLEHPDSDHSSLDTLSTWYAASFGDTLGTDNDSYIVRGEYGPLLWITGDRVAAIKTLYVPLPFAETEYFAVESRAADIGMIWQTFFDGPDIVLSYARVSGEEYGEPVFALNSDQAAAIDGDHLLEVFPNPARDVVHIRWRLAYPHEVTVQLHDVLGRTVTDISFEMCTQACERTINVSELPRGMYFLSIGHDRFRMTRPVVVH